jgi:hypothetical protein
MAKLTRRPLILGPRMTWQLIEFPFSGTESDIEIILGCKLKKNSFLPLFTAFYRFLKKSGAKNALSLPFLHLWAFIKKS